MVVQGEAGIGKSRLVTEALGRLRDPKDVVAFGHGVDLAGGELPYGTAAELLHTLVRDAGLDAVRSAAGEFATTLGSLYPPLGSGVVAVDRVRLLPAFHATIEALAGDRLVWVVVEDLHWVDAPTRDLLAYLVRVAGRGQLLTVVTVRSQDSGVNPAIADLVTTLAALDGVERTVLAPLGRAEVAALVADLTGTGPEAAQLTRIVTLSQGNPLWTEQLLGAGVDPDDSAPQTIIAPILIRLRRLDQPTLWLLQVASLTDGQIPQRLLAAAYHGANDQPEGSFERAVASALAAGLLRFDPATSSYSFAHALLRQASESSISPPDRLAGHRRWAELLIRPPAPRRGPAAADRRGPPLGQLRRRHRRLRRRPRRRQHRRTARRLARSGTAAATRPGPLPPHPGRRTPLRPYPRPTPPAHTRRVGSRRAH